MIRSITLAVALIAVSASASQAQFLSDPAPVRSGRVTQLTLVKEVTGGYPDSDTNVLYSENTALRALMSPDDPYDMPGDNYSFAATDNDASVTSDSEATEESGPYSTILDKRNPMSIVAVTLLVGMTALRANNASSASTTDIIPVDRAFSTSAVVAAPEPSAAFLLLPSVLGIALQRRRQRIAR